MRLSQEAKTPVSARDFWIAVVTTTVALGAFGIYSMQSGHGSFGNISQMAWLNRGLFLFVSAITLYGLIRGGWRVFLGPTGAFLVGYSLYLSDKLWPHPPSWLTWASNIGLLIMCAGILYPYFDFRKKRGEIGQNP